MTDQRIKNKITMTIEDYAAALENAQEEYCEDVVLGFRAIPDSSYAEGDEISNSQAWCDDECTGEELRGACSVGVERAGSVEIALKQIGDYHSGAPIYLVAGDGNSTYGVDENEVILSNPVIIKRIA